jgi:hypothetical protein
MNNTKTLAAIAAIFIAATLVVGGTFAAITGTQSALAYQKKKGGDEKNGNTVTIQKCKQDETASGFDNTGEQECGNTICTHPGTNASCVSENEGAAATTSSSSSSSSQEPLALCQFIFTQDAGGGSGNTGNTQTGTCTITITGPLTAARTLSAGTEIPTSAVSLMSSGSACNGASGLLNTPAGKFAVCVNTSV